MFNINYIDDDRINYSKIYNNTGIFYLGILDIIKNNYNNKPTIEFLQFYATKQNIITTKETASQMLTVLESELMSVYDTKVSEWSSVIFTRLQNMLKDDVINIRPNLYHMIDKVVSAHNELSNTNIAKLTIDLKSLVYTVGMDDISDYRFINTVGKNSLYDYKESLKSQIVVNRNKLIENIDVIIKLLGLLKNNIDGKQVNDLQCDLLSNIIRHSVLYPSNKDLRIEELFQEYAYTTGISKRGYINNDPFVNICIEEYFPDIPIIAKTKNRMYSNSFWGMMTALRYDYYKCDNWYLNLHNKSNNELRASSH